MYMQVDGVQRKILGVIIVILSRYMWPQDHIALKLPTRLQGQCIPVSVSASAAPGLQTYTNTDELFL